MRASALVVALGLALASAKREPAFIPAEDEDTKDPSLNFEPVKSVHYHNVLTKAGRQPVLMAYLDDALEDYAKVHTTFNRAAADFGCLLPERNYMLAAGKDARARFIVDGEGIEMPSVSIFRRKRKVTFAGNWNETELREWVYKELAGLSFVEEDAEYDAFVKKGEKTAVAFVDRLCDPKAAEFSKVLVEYRERTKTQIPAAVSRNRELARILGMEDGTGLVVVGGRGKGPRHHFPEDKMQWQASELQEWMMGVFGKAKFRNTDEL